MQPLSAPGRLPVRHCHLELRHIEPPPGMDRERASKVLNAKEQAMSVTSATRSARTARRAPSFDQVLWRILQVGERSSDQAARLSELAGHPSRDNWPPPSTGSPTL